jgi:hypothetical protein
MRNELFGRLLYLMVNTLFAKVSFHLYEISIGHADIIFSGLLLAFGWLAPQYFSISEVSILDAQRRGSFG